MATMPRCLIAHLKQMLLPALLVLYALGTANGAVVINTWPFTNATRAAFDALTAPRTSHEQLQHMHDLHSANTHHLDAITAGCDRCEVDQCDFTVGYGGSPDTNGETTLDAMILDGTTMDMGAVAHLRRVKAAIRVARAVLHHSTHSVLAGDGALAFAKMMGFPETSLETPHSKQLHTEWLQHQCQPNYFRNVEPAANTSCPPFQPAAAILTSYAATHAQQLVTRLNHDTIGMVALSDAGDMAGALNALVSSTEPFGAAILERIVVVLTAAMLHCVAGTSSNGATHKIAGRVGDAAIVGAGAYVDSRIGGAAATGDGDVMMRFLPSFHAVSDMARGIHPRIACERALARIARVFPAFRGGLVCLNRVGEFGGASHGAWDFAFSVQTSDMREPAIVHVAPLAVE